MKPFFQKEGYKITATPFHQLNFESVDPTAPTYLLSQNQSAPTYFRGKTDGN